jgi:hypothetical protein
MPTARRRQFQPLDRAAMITMLVLAGLIGLMLLSGDRSAPRVRNFNWQDKQIGGEDVAFVLTFSRPMDEASVERHLKIEPTLLGKTSWAGRRMAYTLTAPAPYGTTFRVKLQDAQDRFTQAGPNRAKMQPFEGTFRSRDRAFAYIGTEPGEAGKLILYNLTKQEKTPLTPPNLNVTMFKPYPQGDRILFSATAHTTPPQSFAEQKLYTVTTGISYATPMPPGGLEAEPVTVAKSAGQVELLLDNPDYQNLKFDLSADGQVIVVQRVNRKNPTDFGPWILRPNAPAQPLDHKQPGGDFLITPDSDSLAISQGQGLALLPLRPQAEPLDFLPKFGMVLGFTKDGSVAAMVKFNTDYTRSLFIVTNQGTQKEIFKTTGSILQAQFSPDRQTLYGLMTNLLPGETYREQPYFAAIDLKTALQANNPETALRPLMLLPPQRDRHMSLAPDGLALLFDQKVASAATTNTGPNVGSSLWLLPLTSDPAHPAQPVALPLPGFHPSWMP